MRQREKLCDELIELVLKDPFKESEKSRLVLEGLRDILTDEQKKRLEDALKRHEVEQ